METKLNTNKVLFNKLNHNFKHNIRIWLINKKLLIIITKKVRFIALIFVMKIFSLLL
jgi:hypothetical protein